MNFLRPRSREFFAIVFGLSLLITQIGFGASVPASTNTALVQVQVLPYANYGSVSPNYDGQTMTNKGKTYSMTAYAKTGFKFVNWTVGGITLPVTNKTKVTFSITNNDDLTFIATFTDVQKPVLTITAPPNNSVLTNPSVILAGTASDNDMVTHIYCLQTNFTGVVQDWTGASTGNNWKNWWVPLTLTPGTNFVKAYAVDRSGLISATNSWRLIYSTAPTNISGNTITQPNQEDPNAGSPVYAASFNSGTNHLFSDGSGVGTYNYKKIGPLTGKLALHYDAPPSVANSNDTVMLLFTTTTSGIFTNSNGDNDSFSLAPATNLALAVISGANLVLSPADPNNGWSEVTFLNPPTVVSNGKTNMIVTSNPFTLPISTNYPGNVGDRVRVSLIHFINKNGTWVTNALIAAIGTVANIPDGSDVTVLFDAKQTSSSSDAYSVVTNVPLNIVTCYFTNYTDTLTNAANDLFVYTNYSPVGSLLQLTENNQSDYFILTFTTPSAGSYYDETYVGGIIQNTNTGTFSIVAPPQIIQQPKPLLSTVGETISFSVLASGSPPLAYQWQYSATNPISWSDLTDGTNPWGSTVTGSTTNVLTITGCTNNDIGYYQVMVSNPYSSATSQKALLNLTLNPVITNQPQNVVLTNNETSTNLTVMAAGPEPLHYQWYFETNQLAEGLWATNSQGSYAKFFYVTSTNLDLENISSNFSGWFQVVVTNNYGSVTSRHASVTYSGSGIPTP